MRQLFVVLFLFTTISTYAQDILINEVQSSNFVSYNAFFFSDNFADWIELKNTTATEINLAGYFLSDDPEEADKWTFPATATIPANGFLMVSARGKESEFGEDLSATFKLSAGGESVVLSRPDGTVVHQIEFPAMPNDVSYGRLTDGTYATMSPASPEAENLDGSAFELIDSDIDISVPSGVYAAAQTVEITNTGEGDIFYTLDGSTPNSESLPYTGAITITENTALKAIVIQSSNAYGTAELRSYVIGATHELPVILLTSDNSFPANWNTERINGRVEFNFIETNGTTAISQYADFRVSGKTAPSFPQLNGKVKAENKYGDDDFDHKMYPDKDIKEFESFLLRNSSQDWANTHLRDAFVSRLIGQDNLTDTPFEAYRPAALYINGIYGGIINVREDDDRDYVRHNFGLSGDEFVTKLGQGALFGAGDLDLNVAADQDSFAKRIDFQELVSLDLVRSYVPPGEFGWQAWEDLSGKTGTRFHYNFHDFDPILGLAGDGLNLTTIVETPMPVDQLLRGQMRETQPYKQEGIQFIAASINHIYNTERAFRVLDQMTAELESEIPAHATRMLELVEASTRTYFDREIPFQNLAKWKSNLADLKTNIANRMSDDIFLRIQTEYGLEDPIQVTYNSSDIDMGFVRVHDVKSIEENFTGTYYKELPLRLSAEALPGFRFVRWEGDVSGTDLAVAPVFSADAEVTAVFEAITDFSTTIVINEVQGKNDATVADENGDFDDWIEIYNPDATPVDLAGYYLSDNTEEPLKWRIPATDAAKTTVPPNGYLLLWADKELDQGANHLDFKLKATDEVILTAPDAVTLVQQIAYTDVDTDESYGAETDGATEYVVFEMPTPNAMNRVIVSTTNIENSPRINVYPNPVRNSLTIKGVVGESSWEVFDASGKRIKIGRSDNVDVAPLPPGLYALRINGSYTVKFVKN